MHCQEYVFADQLVAKGEMSMHPPHIANGGARNKRNTSWVHNQMHINNNLPYHWWKSIVIQNFMSQDFVYKSSPMKPVSQQFPCKRWIVGKRKQQSPFPQLKR